MRRMSDEDADNERLFFNLRFFHPLFPLSSALNELGGGLNLNANFDEYFIKGRTNCRRVAEIRMIRVSKQRNADGVQVICGLLQNLLNLQLLW